MANSEERREDRKLVSIELVSLSARVTSVKFQKVNLLSDSATDTIDRTPGTPGSDKKGVES